MAALRRRLWWGSVSNTWTRWELAEPSNLRGQSGTACFSDGAPEAGGQRATDVGQESGTCERGAKEVLGPDRLWQAGLVGSSRSETSFSCQERKPGAQTRCFSSPAIAETVERDVSNGIEGPFKSDRHSERWGSRFGDASIGSAWKPDDAERETAGQAWTGIEPNQPASEAETLRPRGESPSGASVRTALSGEQISVKAFLALKRGVDWFERAPARSADLGLPSGPLDDRVWRRHHGPGRSEGGPLSRQRAEAGHSDGRGREGESAGDRKAQMRQHVVGSGREATKAQTMTAGADQVRRRLGHGRLLMEEQVQTANRAARTDDFRHASSPEDDALEEAGAKALLTLLRSLPSSVDVRAMLAAEVKRGLVEWGHVDGACRSLAEGFEGDPREQELLLAGLSVACSADLERFAVARKWALTTWVVRSLVRKKHFAAARAVPNCWPPTQRINRTRTEEVLTSALLRAGAYAEAVAAYEESLSEGLLNRESAETGQELVFRLLEAKQVELAMHLTTIVGQQGEYAPFRTIIRRLVKRHMFLEAFYTLDVYLKAVAKPHTHTLDLVAREYAKHGYEQTGLEFLAVLRQGGVTPHARVFEVLISAYHRAGLPALADKAFDTWLETESGPDYEVLLTAGKARLAAGDVSEAGALFAQLMQRMPGDLPPSQLRRLTRGLQSLLGAHSASGNVSGAWEVLRWLDARALPYGMDALTPLFEGVLREGRGDVTRLMDGFEEHRRFLAGQVAGRRVATKLHKGLMFFLVGLGLLEDAVAVFEASLSDHVAVPLSTTLRLAYELIEAGHAPVALGILQAAPEIERQYPHQFRSLMDRLDEEQQVPPSE